MTQPTFRVGITRDFLTRDGSLLYGRAGLALDLYEAAAHVEHAFLPEDGPEVRPEWVADFDAVVSLGVRWTAASFAGVQRLAIIARWGVGYDMIDLDAATAAGVAITITPDAVRRPVAVAEVTLLLALTQRLVLKDTLVRRGEWAGKAAYPGLGLTGRTLGSLGIGNIGAELFRLMRPFDMRLIAHDPYADPARAAELDVTLVDLDTLLREADVLCVNCPLLPETRGLIDARALALMKPSAYLINTARGPIVDQAALTAALQRGQIAGAGLDVFDPEPLPAGHPLTTLDNVLLAPHALAWTDQLYRANAESDARAVLAVARGEEPAAIVNRAVVRMASWQAKLAAYRSRAASGGR
jgi:phosphoglycerate dehydrogenase-like enzyme